MGAVGSGGVATRFPFPGRSGRGALCEAVTGGVRRSRSRTRTAVRARCALWTLLGTAVVLAIMPGKAWGDGIFEAISGNVETNYSFRSTKVTDASGNTTRTEINNYNPRFTLNVNYNLFPKLNLNAGATYERNLADPVDEDVLRRTDVTKFRPYVWLTFRDPMYNVAFGYDLREDTVKASGLKTTLTQENYNASLDWRPEGLPRTQLQYTKSNTNDGTGSVLDTESDTARLKSEYVYRGLDVTYSGTYINTRDKIRDFQSTQWSNEGRLIYSATLFNGRTSLSSDNRVNVTTFDTTGAGQGQIGLPVFPFAGLSALDDTPIDGALVPNPALIDGNLVVGAGVNIGRPPLGGDTKRRNLGIDFLSATELNSLQVWTDKELPFEIASTYSWDIYLSTDNLNWTFYQTIPSAPFGPFLNRFELNFPTVRTRYIKVVTRPLSSAVPIPPGFANPEQILITEIQAFLNKPAREIKGSTTRVFQNYTLDVKTKILSSPGLYHDFNAYFTYLDPDGQQQYNVSNGLFLNHSFNPILSTSANASVEFGSQQDESRVAFLYYASLLATPLKTLSNNLVFSGNNQSTGGQASRSNTAILYNTAQLYKGIDANLNLGLLFSTDDQGGGGSISRRDMYVNVGTTVTPNSTMSLTLYYIGKKSHSTGGGQTGSGDTMEHRLDIGASWSPFPALFLSATVDYATVTDQKANIQQNYGLSWTPFPDGQLQFSFFYNDSYFPDRSRTLQPTLRWYFSPRRRSYIDLSYQLSASDSGGVKIESNTISSTLKIYF
jgi:hypothetical protein